MIEPLRRLPRLICLALLPVLPGCLTNLLWATDEHWAERDPRVHTELVSETLETSTGDLVVVAPVLENGICWREHGASGLWRLRPDEGAEVAATLLDGVDWCDVQHARVEAVRGLVGDEVVEDQATLELAATLRPAAIGQVVGRAAISPAALAVLATPRQNAFAFAAEPFLFLPIVYRRCVQRLPAVDLGWLLEQSDPPTFESFVFVGPDGEPRFESDVPQADIPAGADREQLPLSERLALLAEASLLVRVQVGSESLVLRLRPDLLWLWAGTEVVDGRIVHRSSWHFEPTAAPAAPAVGAWTLAGDLVLRHRELRQYTVEPPRIEGFWSKLALTPVAVGLDVLLFPTNIVLWSWLTNLDDEDDSDIGRRR